MQTNENHCVVQARSQEISTSVGRPVGIHEAVHGVDLELDVNELRQISSQSAVGGDKLGLVVTEYF